MWTIKQKDCKSLLEDVFGKRIKGRVFPVQTVPKVTIVLFSLRNLMELWANDSEQLQRRKKTVLADVNYRT